MHPVLAMAIGIVVMMGLIIFTKMHAFPSLIISAILIGLLALPYMGEGATPASVISAVTSGFGGTMASIGVVIGFGCVMGIFLEKSGAAKPVDKIAHANKQHLDAVAATCTTKGNIECDYCPDCGQYFVGDQIIADPFILPAGLLVLLTRAVLISLVKT